jgi:hypothetical protein
MRTSAFANGQTWDLPVPPQGTSTHASFFDPAAYNRLLRPGIATAIPTASAVTNPLKRAFDNVDAQINRWINDAQLAS